MVDKIIISSNKKEVTFIFDDRLFIISTSDDDLYDILCYFLTGTDNFEFYYSRFSDTVEIDLNEIYKAS